MDKRLSRMPIEDLLNWTATAPQIRRIINAAIVQRVTDSIKANNFSLVDSLLSNSESRMNPQCAYEDAQMLLILAQELQKKNKNDQAIKCALLAKQEVEIMPNSFEKVEMYLNSESNGLELTGDKEFIKQHSKIAYDALKRINDPKPENKFSKLCLKCASSLMATPQINSDTVRDCIAMAEEATMKQLSTIEKENDQFKVMEINTDFGIFVMNKAKILLNLGDVHGFLNFYHSAVEIKNNYKFMERNFRDSFIRALATFVPKIGTDARQLDGINLLLAEIIDPDDAVYEEVDYYFDLMTKIVNNIASVSVPKSAVTFSILDDIFKKHHTHYDNKIFKKWQRKISVRVGKELL